jgi:hypothetical protein
LFGDCAVFTNNTAPDSCAGLERVRLDRVRLYGAAERRGEPFELWTGCACAFSDVVNGSPGARAPNQLGN